MADVDPLGKDDQMTPEQKAAISEALKHLEAAATRARGVGLPSSIRPDIFGGSESGLGLAASVQAANEELKVWVSEHAESLEKTLDAMYAEAARMLAADRADSDDDPDYSSPSAG